MKTATRVLLVCALQLISSVALAAHWQLGHTLCPSQLAATIEAIRAFKVPLGCDLPDCCPRCRERSELSLDVQVQGDVAEAVSLRLVGLNPVAAGKVKVTGGTFRGSVIEVPANKSATITGLPANAATWLVPLPRLNSRLLAGFLSEPDPKRRAFSMTVAQRVRDLKVGIFQLDLGFKECRLETASSVTGDRIEVQNIASGPVRSVVDYRNATNVCVADDARATTGSTIFLGATALGPEAGCPGTAVGLCCPSVAVVAQDRAVHYQQITSEWPAVAGIPMSVTLKPKIDMPMAVWIVEQATTIQEAKDIVLLANHIYDGEWEDILQVKGTNHGGVRFVPTFTEVPDDGLGTNVVPDCDPATIGKLKLTRYFSADALNVYVYKSGNSSGYCGKGKGAEIINLNPVDVLGYALEHEIGHALGLRHTDACTDIPHPNVMDPNSSTHGPAFTVAQNMRMHIDSLSILNEKIGSATNPWRVSTSTQTEICPVQNNPWDCATATAACPASGLDP